MMHYHTKCLVVLMISSGQTFIHILNLAVILTMDAVIQDSLAYDDVPSDHIWFPKSQQFRKYRELNHIFIMQSLALTLVLKIANQLQDVIDQNQRKTFLLCRDWNAKVGKDACGNWQGICGLFWNDDTNERGFRLLEFASFNNLVLVNTFGHHKASRSPNGTTP